MAEQFALCACCAHPCPRPGITVPLTWPSRQSCPRGAAGGGSAARCRTRAPCEAKRSGQGTNRNEGRQKVTSVSQSWSSLVQPPTFASRPARARCPPLPPSLSLSTNEFLVLALLDVLLLLLAADGEHVVVADVDFQILLVEAGHLGRHDQLVLLVLHVH